MTDSLKNHDPNFLRTVLNTFPAMVFLVDDDVRILDYNDNADIFINQEKAAILRQACGNVFHCLNAVQHPKGCGKTAECYKCVLRNSVTQAIRQQKIIRQRVQLELLEGHKNRSFHAIINVTPFHYQNENHAILVIEDISELFEFRQIVPICAKCNKIRDDAEYWDRLESYFKKWLDLDFSHGLCPDCYEEEIKKLEDFQPEKPINV